MSLVITVTFFRFVPYVLAWGALPGQPAAKVFVVGCVCVTACSTKAVGFLVFPELRPNFQVRRLGDSLGKILG